MELTLTEEQTTLHHTVAALFAKESSAERVRAAEVTGLDERLWKRYCATGAVGISVPAEMGGGGGGLLEMALVAEEGGRRLAPIPIVESAVAARLLGRAGADDLLEPVLTGSRIVSLAVGAAPLADQLLVDGAIADAVLALRAGSLRYVARPSGMAATPRSNLGGLALARWGDVEDGASIVEGPAAAALFDAALDEVRVLRAAALVGLASEAIEIGARYAVTRTAFGQPIGMYQAVAHPFADAVTARDGAQLLVWKACWALDAGRRDGSELAAMAFVFAAETAYQAAAHSLHVHGGYGFMEEYDIQLYYRRAKAWAAAFADPRRELLAVADRRFGPAASGAVGRSREGG